MSVRSVGRGRHVLARVVERLTEDEGCLVCSLGVGVGGYAQVKVRVEPWTPRRYRTVQVHRLVYELYHGPIPDGLVIDHKCRNRACCRIEHLRLVTPAVNTQIGEAPSAVSARTGLCQKGLHPLSGPNLYRTTQGNRACKACISAQKRERRLAKEAA